MTIGEHGQWLGTDGPYLDHHFDAPLADAIMKIVQPGQSILDIGCGNGAYVAYWNIHGRHANGVDGNPAIEGVQRCKVMDVALPMEYFIHDWVVSLEVGEHIPEAFMHTYLDNLTYHCKFGVILSWAILGQGGTAHVNERCNEEIFECMNARGFAFDLSHSKNLREAASVPWFKNTVMVYTR